MNETMTRFGRKPKGTEKIDKRLLVWVTPSQYNSLLEECQAAGYASLGAYVREAKLGGRAREEVGLLASKERGS